MKRSVLRTGIAALLLAVIASAAIGAKAEQTIGTIYVVGNKIMSSEAVITMSGHKIGDPCTRKTLEEMRNRLARTGYFGMHHPGKSEEGVKIQAEDIGDEKCVVTITVDENDRITKITVTGTEPIKPEDVRDMIHPGAVYNPEEFRSDVNAIVELYKKAGYVVDFSDTLGPDPLEPDTLIVPIVVTKVDDLVIEGVTPKRRAQILKRLKTKKGDYFNTKTLYGVDRTMLTRLKYVGNASFAETPLGKGRMKIVLSIDPK